MTAPLQQSSSVTIDDVESQLTTPEGPKLDELKLDGASIPEDLRGKSVSDLVAMAKKLEESLRLSEQGRIVAQQQAEIARLGAQKPTAPPPPPEPELTDEQLAEMMQADPVKAVRVMQAQAEKKILANMESRVGTISQGATAAIEAEARRQYAEEFAALGPEISQTIQNLPDKSVLTNPVAWDQLIGFVRGQKGNFEKFMAYKESKKGANSLAMAQAGQAAIVGASFTPAPSAPVAAANEQLDDYTREIAEKLNMSPQDYVKWRKIT